MEEKKEEEKKEEEKRKMVEIGKVTHFFGKVNVAVIELTKGDLKVGDTIYIKGHTSDFEQKVDSMQVDNAPIKKATKGRVIGIQVKEHVREHDMVYKVTE